MIKIGLDVNSIPEHLIADIVKNDFVEILDVLIAGHMKLIVDKESAVKWLRLAYLEDSAKCIKLFTSAVLSYEEIKE